MATARGSIFKPRKPTSGGLNDRAVQIHFRAHITLPFEYGDGPDASAALEVCSSIPNGSIAGIDHKF